MATLAACGVRQEIIASRIGIDAKTLRKTCRRELQVGKADACAIVAESLFRMATGNGRNAVTAAIFWLKCQAGWRETAVVQNQALGANGKPINPPKLPDLTQPVSAEQARRDYWELVGWRPAPPS